MKNTENITRKRVYEFYIQNRHEGKKFTVDHFLKEKVPISTTYTIIARAENDNGHERVPGSGRIAKKMPPKKIAQLEKTFNNQSTVSYRSAARKFKISHTYVKKLLRTKQISRKEQRKSFLTALNNSKQRQRQNAQGSIRNSRIFNGFWMTSLISL